MPFDMIDTDQRNVQTPRQSLCIAHADEQRADQSGTLRNGNRVNILKSYVRFCQRFSDNRLDFFEMLTRRQFGKNSAERTVQFDLRRNDRRQNLSANAHNRRRRFVARTFDAQNQHS